ncbi:nucleolar protein 12 [Sphaeramia orbicularis]|uniref:Nucleolar protein 12 n=1 Tax=Sphaeramia orbicularis TaxID=375764 RepID=A0A673A1X9_9TELE|nr:nucleolar protein 12 [Sphaeramia orbicularis]
MKNRKKHNDGPKKSKFKPGFKKRENKCVIMFDDKDRQDYLTGFHKRKVERRKAAVAELKKKIKEEQIKVREERHNEYMKMLKERTEALEDDKDDLEDAITSTTESIQYDHPNHTVTVTTISDLDLTGAHLLGPVSEQVNGEGEDDGKEEEEEKGTEKKTAMPRKAGQPIMNKKIRSLTTSLSTYTSKRKRKGKQEGRGHMRDKRPAATESKARTGRTTRRQRRRQTGKKVHHQD